MTPARLVIIVAVAGGLGFLIWKGLFQPRPENADVLSGFVEGEALYLASPVSGAVTGLSVARGQRVQAAAPLFTIDARSPAAQRDQAAARWAEAKAQALAAEATVQQQSAALAQTRAQAASAQRDAERYAHTGAEAVSAQEVDRARTTAATAALEVEAAANRLNSSKAQQAAAEAAADQARAALADIQARLDLLSVRAPATGRIEEVYYQAGEWAGANQPIVSLIPDGKVKLKFYVPERDLALYQLGRKVRFGCDGCRPGAAATIAYVSPRPEYTPPIIYSRKSRDRLVFLVEAQPDAPRDLTPGLPIDVLPIHERTPA